jgi:hypothetical protein
MLCMTLFSKILLTVEDSNLFMHGKFLLFSPISSSTMDLNHVKISHTLKLNASIGKCIKYF